MYDIWRMQLKEHWKEGFLKGYQEGRYRTNRDIVLYLHSMNYDDESIAKYTKTPVEQVKRLLCKKISAS